MSKPYIHAQSSARKFGGVPEDYLEIHSFMDSSKGAVPSNIHRALTHQSWFLSVVLERVKFANSVESPDGRFYTIKNSAGRQISVRDIGEQHILEDFRGKFIPTAQDYLCETQFKPWMQNGGAKNDYPPSYSSITKVNNTDISKVILDGLDGKCSNNQKIRISGDGQSIGPESIFFDGSNIKPFKIDLDNKINPVYHTD